MKGALSIIVTALLLCSPLNARNRRHSHPPQTFQATAYADHDVTASGKVSRRGLVAADPDVLPLGSRIQVSNAGAYSGVYTVADTGSKVQGRHIDIFIPNRRQAKVFGKKTVLVRVLRRGPPDVDVD
jgi:3D (Asp-Asp-Asp) domain-containing protein